MAEETTEQPRMADYTNDENPVVSDDILQNMRRGLFGKSAGTQEEDSSNEVSEIQENSNGSADTTDDPMKNGLSMEDKEATKPRSEKEDSPIHIQEADPKEVDDSGEDSTPVIEEPADEPMEQAAEAEEPEAEAEIEIREVVGQISPSQVIAVEPIVIEPSLQGQEVVEDQVESLQEEEDEVAVVPNVVIEGEDEEQAEEEQEGEAEEQNAVPDDPVHSTEEECKSPPPTPSEPNQEEVMDVDVVEPHIEQLAVEEEEEEEEEDPKSRSRRSVKQTPKTPARTSRGRRSKAVDEEEEPQESHISGRGEKATEEEPEEQAVEEEKEEAKVTPQQGSKRGRGKNKEEHEEETPATKRTTRRGRGQKEESEQTDEAPKSTGRRKREQACEPSEDVDVEEIAEPEEEMVATPQKGRRGKAAPKNPELEDDTEEKEEKEEEPEDEEVKSLRSTKRGARGRTTPRGKKVKAEKEEEPEPKEEEEVAEDNDEAANKEEEPKDEQEEEEEVKVSRSARRGARGKATPRGKKTKVEKEEEPSLEEEEEEDETEEVKTPRSTRRGARGKATPRGKKTKAEEEKEESGEEEEKEVPKTRSLRGRGAKSENKATPAKTPARSASAKKVDLEEDEDEEMEEPKEQSKTPKGRSKTKKVTPKSDEPDPYDMETQMDAHPDPLKNVVVSEGLFGSHKYGKIGSGKYTFTERAAEERVGNLSDFVPKQINRRSLADLTPGRRRQTASAKGAKSAPPARKRKTTETDEDDMDIDQPGSSNATPVSRKRKTSPAPASAAKKANKEVELPSLSADSQWIVDHPPDEHAPIEIGARVYAVFSKVYYPAVVVAERDGLGRYKVKFIEDAVVRDIPAQGIVPLRAVVAEKECYYGDEGAVIMACPNAASASEWTKAIFTIRQLDNDGEVKGNDVKCDWSKLSLDMNDWKDYIHQKSIEATAVATDNIAHTRTRRHTETPKKTPVPVAPIAKKKLVKKTVKAPRKENEEEEDISTENEKAENESDNEAEVEEEEDNHIFSGMVFLLTSAQRDGNNTFKKKMLLDFIQERGGLVVEDFHDLELHNDMQPFLISDTFYRTHKYLSALAKGVPCVSHEWIHKCIEVEEAVDYNEYILPAGTSSINNETYPAPQNQNSLLRGKNVLVYSGGMTGNPRAISYYNIWEPLVVYMGGRALRHLTDITREEKLDVILTDNTVTEVMLERAERDGSWVVTSEWLIHAIIMDRLTDPDEYPRFKVQKSLRPAPSDPE